MTMHAQENTHNHTSSVEAPVRSPLRVGRNTNDRINEFGDLHLSPYRSRGLGQSAVSLSFIDRLYSPEDDDISEFTLEYIQDARARLEQLSHVNKKAFGKLLSEQPMSFELNEKLGVDEASMNALLQGDSGVDAERLLVDSLTRRTDEGEYAIDDATFLEFLAWHNQVLADRQRELHANQEQYVADFTERVTRAVKEGWIPEGALAHTSRFDSLELIQDDGISMMSKSEEGTINGESIPLDGIDHVALRPETETVTLPEYRDLRSSLQTLTHEFVHTIEGRRNNDRDGDNGVKNLFTNPAVARAMNEAVTEHIASSLLYGSVDKTNVLSHVRKGSVYFAERTILESLCNRGIVPVNIRSFITAYFEDTHDATPTEAQTQLCAELKEAFPYTDVLADLDSFETVDEMYEYGLKLFDRSYKYKGALRKDATRHPVERLRAHFDA